jgi:hypothetical protein
MVVEVSSCGGSSGEVVARVGDAVVTRSAVEHWLSIGAAANALQPTQAGASDPVVYGTRKQRTLGFLIASDRTIGEAAERNIGFTDGEARTTLEFVHYEQIYGNSTLPQDAELKGLLSHKGETPADQLWIVKVHMLAAKLEELQLAEAEQRIAGSQIAAYYARNRRSFVIPERRDVAVIETFRKDKAEQAVREINAGKAFLDVMKRRDDEPDVGGLKLGMTRRSLRHEYEENYFHAKPHVVVGPLKAEIYYLFEVMAIVPERQQTLREVQSTIRRKLVAGPQRQVLTGEIRALGEQWRSKTRCRAGYQVEQCGSQLT